MNKIKIPITWDKNKIRGNSYGYLINTNSFDYPEALNQLKKSIKENAIDFVPDDKYITKAIIDILKLCEENIKDGVNAYLAQMKNGDKILFADERLLNRIADFD